MFSVVNTRPPPLPSPRRGLAWWHFLCIAAAVLLAVCLVGLLAIGLLGPETFVEAGNRMPPHRKAKIRAVAGLATNETIRYFYSTALIDIAGEGNLLTDRGVYSWYRDPAPHLDRALFREIADVSVKYAESWPDDTTVTVTLTNDDFLVLVLSRERGGDRKFVRALLQSVEAQRGGRRPPG